MLTTAKFLTDSEMIALQLLLSRYAISNPRDVALLRVAIETGARASEVLSVKVCDVDFDKRTVLICGLKGSNDRELPLTEGTTSMLLKLSFGKHREDLIFGISYSMLQKIWKMYRPVKKKFHSLRHSKGKQIYEKTLDLMLVKFMLGHKSMNSTFIYLNYVEAEAHQKRLAGLLDPAA